MFVLDSGSFGSGVDGMRFFRFYSFLHTIWEVGGGVETVSMRTTISGSVSKAREMNNVTISSFCVSSLDIRPFFFFTLYVGHSSSTLLSCSVCGNSK